MMNILKFFENFELFKTKKIIILKILKFYMKCNFENFDLFLQFDWPTGNEISSLVGQR